ncbi:MAG: hypothetical protein ABWX93_04320 [Pseudoxanthomonas sp.]
MRFVPSLFSLCMLALSVPLAHAQDLSVPFAEVMAQQQEIRKEVLQQTGRYAEMPAVKRDAILREQDKLFPLLEGKSDASALNPNDRTKAINALEAISSAINNKEDERVVCERVKRTGSQQITRVCKSVAQIKFERERARNDMQSGQSICTSGCNLN